MGHIVRATELRERFKTLFDRVIREEQTLIVTRHNQPKVVVMPYGEFLRFQQFRDEEGEADPEAADYNEQTWV